jgi:hypothetical protein
MTDQNTQVFLDFWQTYQWPEQKPVSYRLYYNEQGLPVEYSMDELPGKYIEVTAEQFAERDHRVKVKNQQLIKIIHQTPTRKLIPAEHGTPCHRNNVAIVVDSANTHKKWKLTQHENS